MVPHLLEYGESRVGEEASQNSGPNASFDAELEPSHEAQENASNYASAPANSNVSSLVHSFTAPNTSPPTYQTLTPIHLSTDPTLDPVYHSSDPIPNPVHPSNEQDSDRESLNGDLMREQEKKGPDAGYDKSTGANRNNLEGKLAGDEPYYPSDETVNFETDPDAFSDDEEEVQQREKLNQKGERR
ncbi:hypothetical protein H5410_025557 [Solanum commersonii]|uniref:Uncharacterized protein n=1 Tax=Solanum commersonii TaxID=4109 RepID=A0A9J5YU39_SOLCO|nr:hypothetical protein H5410_025557 [Solanum commersonii]